MRKVDASMSALELLENRTRLDAHLASHAYAERIYEHVQELIGSGSEPSEIRDALRELHRRAREKHQVIERDAYVEVLDALDEDYPHLGA